MNLNKLGLLAVTGAGVMAIAIARSAADQPPSEAAPARAKTPAATAAKAAAAPVAQPVAAPHAPAPNAPPAVATGPAGKAEVKELLFDAGTVERGADIKHDFVIRNVGQHDLTVDAKPG